MKNYKDLKSFSLGNSDSEYLEGAISSNLLIPYYRTYWYDEFMREGIASYDNVSIFVPESFDTDTNNDIFTDENGAVANAYKLSNMSEQEKQETIKNILEKEKENHPEYDYKMIEGNFPIDINGGMSFSDGRSTNDTPVMSTHILYITNYKEFINTKTKVR